MQVQQIFQCFSAIRIRFADKFYFAAGSALSLVAGLTSVAAFPAYAGSQPHSRDQLQGELYLNECLYSQLGKVISPFEFKLYALDELNGLKKSWVEENIAIENGPDNTTALRLENKFWSKTERIQNTLSHLKARFPGLGSRDPGVLTSNVRSDICPTFRGSFYLDKISGKLLLSEAGEVPQVDSQEGLAHDPRRFEKKEVNFKLRIRKYEGSPLTVDHSKIEIKFKSLVEGAVHKPSVLFADSDVAILLAHQEPSIRQVAEIRDRTLANPNNHAPEEVDQILDALPLIRKYSAHLGVPFSPVVHLGYVRFAQELLLSSGDTPQSRFSLQFTHDYGIFAKSPQIVPKMLDPNAHPSDRILAEAPPDISVLEVKRPVFKAGVSDRLKRRTRWFKDRVYDQVPDLKAVDRILSPLLRSAVQKDDFKVDKGKRFAAGHGALIQSDLVPDDHDRGEALVIQSSDDLMSDELDE